MSSVAWNIDHNKEYYKASAVWKTAMLFKIETMDTCLYLSWNKDAYEDCKGKEMEITTKTEL